jgi:hypothetical protein
VRGVGSTREPKQVKGPLGPLASPPGTKAACFCNAGL